MSGHVMLFPQRRSVEDWEKILPFGREALVTQNICFCWQTASHVSALLDGVGCGLGGGGGDGGGQRGEKGADGEEEEHHFFCPVSKSGRRLVFIRSLVRETVPGAYLLSQKVYKQI